MLMELLDTRTVEELDEISIKLLNPDAFRKLQEEMVEDEVALYRGDYWPTDVLNRRTSDTEAVKKALGGLVKESKERRLLHILQIITKTSPGATDGVQRFLKKVTFT